METKTKKNNHLNNNNNSDEISNGVSKNLTKARNGKAEDSRTKKTSREAGKSNRKKYKRKLAKEEDEQNGYEEREDEGIYRFQINRVNKIIRSEEVDFRINQEAIFLVSKATEKFLDQFSEDAYMNAVFRIT